MSETTKLTTLDVLSSMEINPEFDEIRADYWIGVAERHIRANREEQAQRLFDAVRALRRRAKEMRAEERARNAKTKDRAKGKGKGRATNDHASV